MKFKRLFFVVFIIFFTNLPAAQLVHIPDSTKLNSPILLDTDSILNIISAKNETVTESNELIHNLDSQKVTENRNNLDSSIVAHPAPEFTIPINLPPVEIDTLLLSGNPFFIDLVFMGYPQKFSWHATDLKTLFYGKPATNLSNGLYKPFKIQKVEEIIDSLRAEARNEITRKAADLYIMTYDQLPDPNANKSHFIETEPLENIQLVENNHSFRNRNNKIYVKREYQGPWLYKASGLAQFSENTVTQNWYQGGNNNVAVLGILSGQLNYDNKKSIQWENSGEWRVGFNTVPGDTIHMLSTNDDIFRINSKLGIKASGNFFYSGSVDFSTQFFDSYKGVNSIIKKTSFLTPVRLNIGVGLDYKYKKLFSLMFSPVSYKYIYVNDTLHVDPNLFGIKKGQNVLSEIGSSFTAQLSYPITHEIQLDSKLYFFTNYEKVQVDWEIVCNMVINRFMSTRVSINPRFDNTVIMPNGDKAQLQFKQLVSVGFSHRFR